MRNLWNLCRRVVVCTLLAVTSVTAATRDGTAVPSHDEALEPAAADTIEDGGIPPVLLVDDDDNEPDVRPPYTEALDSLGLFYDVWDTENSDNEPTVTDLEPYDLVVWFTGHEFDGFAGPGADGETALGAWLDGGGCYFMSSQDYLFDRGLTSFMQDYLGVGSFENEQVQSEVTGAGSVFGGLGPYVLNYPFKNFSDVISPDGTTELAFSGDAGNAAVNKDGGIYRTTFWGFPFEALPDDAAREEALQAVLTWCDVGGATGFIAGTVSDLDSGDPLVGASVATGSIAVQTDPDGSYSMRVPVGTHDVVAAAENYVPVMIAGVQVEAEQTTEIDFELEGSSLLYEPSSIEEEMDSGQTVITTVTVSNVGPLPIEFSARIKDFTAPEKAPAQSTRSIPSGDGTFPRGEAPPSALAAPPDGRPVSGVSRSEPADFDLLLGSTAYAHNAAFEYVTAFDVDMPEVLPNIGAFDPGGFVGAGELIDGSIRMIDVNDNTMYEFDPATGDELGSVPLTPPSSDHFYTGMALDPTTGRVYLSSCDNIATSRLYLLDVATGKATTIGTMINSPCTIGIAIDGAGELYGFDTIDDSLLRIDKSTAEATIIGSLGFDSNFGQGMAWDPATDALLLASFNNSTIQGELRVADRQTGGTELLGVLGATDPGGTSQLGFLATELSITPAWAFAEPGGGTVEPGETFTFDVIFDATQLAREGTYTANLEFVGGFVNDVPLMPLTMHLNCSTCGSLEGVITDASTGEPVSATVTFEGEGGFVTTATGETYSVSVPADIYTLQVEADGYFVDTTTVELEAGETVVTDFALTPMVAILEYDPAALEEELESGDIVTKTVTLTNPGNIPLDFSVRIKGFVAPGEVSAYAQNVPFGYYTIFDLDAPEVLPSIASFDPGGLIGAGELLDGSVYMIDGDNTMYEVDSATGEVLGTVSVSPPSGTHTYTGMALDPTTGELYLSSCDADTGTSRLYLLNVATGEATTLGPVTSSPCTIGIAIDGAGELYGYDSANDSLLRIDKSTAEGTIIGSLGFDAHFDQGMAWNPATDALLLAAFNNDAFQAELRVADRESGNTDLVGVLGATDPGDTSLLGFLAIGPGMTRPWAFAEPNGGTVEPGGTFTMDVTFDATLLAREATYTARLEFSGNFSNDPAPMPLTMHLTCPTCGTLEGVISDAFTGEPVSATVEVTGNGGFNTTVSGETYSVAAPADHYTVEVEADGYFPDSVEVDLGDGETLVTDFELTPMVAVLEYSPQLIEETLPPDGTMTNPVSVTNTGTVPLSFSVWIRDFAGPQGAETRSLDPWAPTGDGSDSPRADAGSSALEIESTAKPRSTPAAEPLDLASLLGTAAYAQNAAFGYYTVFDLEMPEVLPSVVPFDTGRFIGAGEFVNGSVYMLDESHTLYEVDPETGDQLSSTPVTPAPAGAHSFTGLALDPTTGAVYATTCDRTTTDLYLLNVSSGEVSLVGMVSNSPCTIGIAIDGTGTLYGYDIINDSLLQIDKSSADGTIIGPLGFDANFGQGMAWDPADDILYLAAFNDSAIQAELRHVVFPPDADPPTTELRGVLGQADPGVGPSQLGYLATELSPPHPWATAVPDSGTVEPGQTLTFEVTFDALQVEELGTYSANLYFNGNFSNEPAPMTLVMHATSVVGPDVTFDPTNLDFGEVEVGDTSSPQGATLTNSGDADATGLAFSMTGASFEVDTSDCGPILTAGTSCEVFIAFMPVDPGSVTATLRVDSGEGATANLGLAGTGVGGGGFTPTDLEVDSEPLLADGNGVFEPGELVEVAPVWRNDGAAVEPLTGTASSFNGADGAIYFLALGDADYGDIEPAATASCRDTGVCYFLAVNDPTPRPAMHWEASVDEALSGGTAHAWSLHIGDSFADVPRSSPFYTAVETLLHHGVTGGCDEAQYCPAGANTRGQMAIFLLRAAEGEDYVPPACTEDAERFADVPFDHPLCPWIEELAERGVTAGCDSGNYCPGNPVSRAQMAVFLLKVFEGDGYTPQGCTGMFSDVDCPSTFADWVEELAGRGVTGGCGGDPPAYCPAAPVTRAQMAVFVTKAFGLTLYGP